MLARVLCLLALGVLCFSGLRAEAETLTFPTENYAIEQPAGWLRSKPPTEQFHLYLHSPDKSKAILVMLKEVERDARIELAAVYSGMRKGVASSGAEIVSESIEELAGIRFNTYVGKNPNGVLVRSWIASSPERFYAVNFVGDPAAEEELAQVRKTFRFLRPFVAIPPVEVARMEPKPDAERFQLGYRIGYYSGYVVLLLVLVGVVVAVRRNRRKGPPPLTEGSIR